MKKLSTLILLISIFLTGCAAEKKPVNVLDNIKAKDKIVVGIKTDSKPFGFIRNNEITGFDADIAYEAAKKIFMSDSKSHVQFVPLTPSERITALNTGRVDIVVATFSINEKRKDIIDFSIPYYVAGQALMVPQYSRLSSITQLNDKPVAIVLGTTGERTIRLLAPNANVTGVMSYKEAFELLAGGKVEAILADDSLLYGLMADNKGYKILPSRYTEEFYAIGLRQGDDTSSLKNQLDETIRNLEQSGKLSRIKEKWIPQFKMK